MLNRNLAEKLIFLTFSFPSTAVMSSSKTSCLRCKDSTAGRSLPVSSDERM